MRIRIIISLMAALSLNILSAQDYRDKYTGTYTCRRDKNASGDITTINDVNIYISKNIADTLLITIIDSSFLQEGNNDSQYDAVYDTLSTDRFKVYFYYTGYCQFYITNDSLLMYINGGINSSWYLSYYYYGKKINTVVEDNNEDDKIILYPNPANTKFSLYLSKNIYIANYALFDIRGCVQQEGKTTNSQTEINVADLPRGMYILKVVTDKQTFAKKVLLQ